MVAWHLEHGEWHSGCQMLSGFYGISDKLRKVFGFKCGFLFVFLSFLPCNSWFCSGASWGGGGLVRLLSHRKLQRDRVFWRTLCFGKARKFVLLWLHHHTPISGMADSDFASVWKLHIKVLRRGRRRLWWLTSSVRLRSQRHKERVSHRCEGGFRAIWARSCAVSAFL